MTSLYKGISGFFFHFLGVCAFLIILFIGYLLGDFWYNRLTFIPIVTTYEEKYMKNPTVAPGGRISFRFNSIRNGNYENCRIEIDRYIKSDAGFEYFLSSHIRQPVTTTSGTSLVSIDIPEDIEPGKYYFESRGKYYCAQLDFILGPEYSYSPKVYFEIIPRSTSEFKPSSLLTIPKTTETATRELDSP